MNQSSAGSGLEIVLDGKVVTMEWPFVHVEITDGLKQDLQKLIGPAGDVRTTTMVAA